MDRSVLINPIAEEPLVHVRNQNVDYGWGQKKPYPRQQLWGEPAVRKRDTSPLALQTSMQVDAVSVKNPQSQIGGRYMESIESNENPKSEMRRRG